MRSDSRSLFQIDQLFQLIKRAVEKADLESLGSSVPADEFDFECREIAERLSEGDGVATVEALTTWLAAYWALQFGATATEEWLLSRDFRALAVELIACLHAVDTPATHLEYFRWQRGAVIGYATTNEELLSLARFWAARLVELFFERWASEANCSGIETDFQYAVRRLRQIAEPVGYGETRRVMMQEFSQSDECGLIGSLHSGQVRSDYAELDLEALQTALQGHFSLYAEAVLTQDESNSLCDWEDLTGSPGSSPSIDGAHPAVAMREPTAMFSTGARQPVSPAQERKRRTRST